MRIWIAPLSIALVSLAVPGPTSGQGPAQEPGPGVEGPSKVPEKAGESTPDEGASEKAILLPRSYRGRLGGRRRLATSSGRQIASAIQDGLDWLVRHQDRDGAWSASRFLRHESGEQPACDGTGSALHDVGVTGLALLAFLGDGSSPRGGPHREVVARGVRWLRVHQRHDGLIGQQTAAGYAYDHAIATLALVEAYGMSRRVGLKKHVESALRWIERARNPHKVWRYQPRGGDSDTSVTGWMVQCLVSARDVGLPVDENALKFAMAWYEQVTDPRTGQAGYTRRGEGSSRPEGLAARFPATSSEALTASGLFHRMLLGQRLEQDPVLMTAADSILRHPPRIDGGTGSIDCYYWYYGTMALYQIGGKHWKEWSRAIRTALLASQRENGCAKGSWDPIGVWGAQGGRVYSTAIAVLTLETNYRYAKLSRR